MRLVRLGWVVLVVAAAAMPVLAQRVQFRSGVDLVRLPVVVLDRGGKPIQGLTIADFEIYDNGRKQEIASFAQGSASDESPLHIGIMIDKSQSMDRSLPEAANAAVRLVNAATDARDVTYIEFDSSVRTSMYEPDRYPELFNRIRESRYGDKTVLYDALTSYANTSRDVGGVHVLVLYTDGADAGSVTRLPDVMDALRQGNAVVYAVGYVVGTTPEAVNQRRILTSLSRETGGEAFFPGSPRDLPSIYSRIVEETQARYSLAYRPAEIALDSKPRKIEVRLTNDIRGAKVRTRLNYVLGEP